MCAICFHYSKFRSHRKTHKRQYNLLFQKECLLIFEVEFHLTLKANIIIGKCYFETIFSVFNNMV